MIQKEGLLVNSEHTPYSNYGELIKNVPDFWFLNNIDIIVVKSLGPINSPISSYFKSKRSAFITLDHAATKSSINFSLESSQA